MSEDGQYLARDPELLEKTSRLAQEPTLGASGSKDTRTGFLAKMKERFRKGDDGQLEIASGIVRGQVEGNALFQVAIDQFDSGKQAAAEADRLGGRQWEIRKEVSQGVIQNVEQMSLAARVLIAGDLTPEQVTQLEADPANWRKLAIEIAKTRKEMVVKRREEKEARGEKPDESLSKEQERIQRIENNQTKQVEAGLRIMEVLLDEGGYEIEDLKVALLASNTFNRNEAASLNVLAELSGSLQERYPDRAADIAQAHEAMLTERKANLESVVLRDSQETGVNPEKAKELAETLLEGSRLQRPENQQALMEALGILVEEDPESGEKTYSAEAGKWFWRKLHANTNEEIWGEDLVKALEQAAEDPRLANQALGVALTLRIGQNYGEVCNERIKREILIEQARERNQIKVEEAKARGKEFIEKSRENYDKLLTIAARASSRTLKIMSQVAAGSMATLGAIASAPGLAIMATGAALAAIPVGVTVASAVGFRYLETAGEKLDSHLLGRRSEREGSREQQISTLQQEIEARQRELEALTGRSA
jgi:hypothetical protein